MFENFLQNYFLGNFFLGFLVYQCIFRYFSSIELTKLISNLKSLI